MKKVLLVGFGSIGQRHLKNVRELLPDSEIMIYRQHSKPSDEIPEGANKLVFDLESALSFKPEAVIISTPANKHVENAEAFLKDGAHLFIEKPLSINASNCEKLITALNGKKQFAMVGYVLRFQPMMSQLKNYLNEGHIGDIKKVFIEVGQYLPDWRPSSDYRRGVSAQKILGGGVLLELSHEVDYSTWLFGFPDEVTCSCDKLSDLEIDVEDSATIILDYKKNSKKRVVINLDFLQRSASMRVCVIGSKGTLRADLIQEDVTVFFENNRSEKVNFSKMTTFNEMYLRQFDLFFARAFKNYKVKYSETENHIDYVDLEAAAKVIRLVDLSKKSNEQGRRLEYS